MHTHTHTLADTQTHTHTHRLAERVKAPLFQGSGSEPKATFTVRCTDLLHIQCKVSELIETKMCFYVNAPSCSRECTNEAQGQQEHPETISWRILIHWIDFFFFFMIEKSSLIHRILITHGISHTTS